MTQRFTPAIRASVHAGAMLFALASVTCARVAHAEERPAQPADTWPEARWTPQPVRYPVAPAQVQPDPPHVPEHAGTVTGPIEIGPEHAATLWLDALDVVRVRRADASTAESSARAPGGARAMAPRMEPKLVLRRVVGTRGEADARVRSEIEESPVIVAPGVWHVAQPPERGGVWVIAASAPMRVVIERPAWRDARADARAWEEARSAVLRWIENGGPMPELPPDPDGVELALGLRADHALAQLLLRARADAPRFGQPVRDWRSASALTRLATVGAHRQPYHWFEERTSALAAQLVRLRSGSRPYARTRDQELTWSAVIEGPGTLEIDVRAVLPAASQREDGVGLLRIAAGDRVLIEQRYERRRAYVATAAPPPDPAFPRRAPLRLPDGAVAGPRERVRVALLPGKHTYRLALRGGESLVRARVARRRPRLLEVLRGRVHAGDYIAAASDALDGDATPAAALLARLLAELRGEAVAAAPAGLSPLLGLVAEIAPRRGHALDGETVQALIERAQPLLLQAARDGDPALSWMLRRDLTVLAARTGSAAALAAATRDAGDAPPVVAARMAELAALAAQDGPHAAEAHALALASALRAWRAAPLDASIRQALLRVWRVAPPWSRLGPDATDEPEALPRYRFIERAPEGSAPAAGDAAPVRRNTLWPIEPGQRQRVAAAPSPADHRRPVRMRAYVATPPQAPGHLRLHVDDHVFAALPLSAVETLDVAVPPGAHEVMLEAPAGTAAFLSVAPEDPLAPRARIRARRPAWDQGRATRFAVPEGAGGMPARVTLRVALAEGTHGPEPVRVRLRTDAGHTRSIAIQPGAPDRSWIPVDGAARVLPPVRAVLWLPPDARWVSFEPEQPRAVSQLWASIAMRQPGGQPGSEPAREPPAGAGVSDHSDEEAAQPAPVSDVRTVAPDDPAWPAIVDEIAAMSRTLAASPDDTALRLRRAHLLLDIGEVGRVALDFQHLAALPPERLSPEQRAARDRLEQRLDDWRDPRYLPVQPQPFERPVALAPAPMALVSEAAGLDDWQPAVLAARTGDRTLLDATARSHDTLLARYYRAALLRRHGAHARAAAALRDIYEETGARAIGLEALLAFEDALAERQPDQRGQLAADEGAEARPAAENAPAAPDAPAEELASIAYGLALRMRERFAHPVVRRVLFAAARRSRWETLRGAEGSAGFESIRVDEELLDPDPGASVARALIAPPWPREEAGVVRPGRAALLGLSLQAPARIRPEAWCQRVRPAPAGAGDACAVRWRVTGQPERALDLPLARVTALGTATLPAGRHELEVVLAHDDPTVRLVVRFATSRSISGEAGPGGAVSILRPGRMHVAGPAHPVTATVLGPTTIRVEARRYMDEPPLVLVAEARPASQDTPATALVRQVHVDAEQDASARGHAQRDLRLSGASTTVLVLPAATAYRLVLRPQQGRALVRLWHRRDVPGETPPPAQDLETPARVVEAPVVPAASAWPAAFEPDAGNAAIEAPAPAATPWPTLSAGLSFRRDDLADRDVEDEPLENRLQLDLAWRRELVPQRFWLRIEPALRWHPGSTPAYGASADLAWRRLPLDLRLDAMARAYAQSTTAGLAWTAQGRARVGRGFRLRPSLTLVPLVAVHARWYSLDGAPADTALDPLVFNQYDRAHRFGARPEATLYWRPLQDQLGLAGARVVTNEDFYSPDRAELELAWRGIAPWPRPGFPVFDLHYRPGWRFEDAGRSRGYLRHDLGVRLDWSLWNGRHGRWLLEVRDDAYLSTVWGNRNVFLVGIRYDFVDGRGLRDMLPIEYRFDELIEPPPWAD